MEHNHNKESILGGIVGFLYSIIMSFFTHIDWWAVLQSVICAVLGFVTVRLLAKYFPKDEII